MALCVDIDENPVLYNVNFSLKAGQLLHVKGKNGAGKTTLLRSLVGLCPLLSGSVTFEVSSSDDTMGYLGHKLALEPLLTVEENLKMATLGETLHTSPNDTLKSLGLFQHRNRFCDQLSQGQKKRLSLARFICVEKSLWLLDEPFTALDSQHQTYFKVAMESFVKKGGSILLTSHMDFDFNGIDWRELTL
tara:strand:- start:591 stop:1160 length:570 start_codon:yes stop_codon:yes gene_type:complete